MRAVFLMNKTLLSPDPPPAGAPPHHSEWISPIPYLYGGIAAMFGLIVLALLILACTYFRNPDSRDEEGGSQKSVTNRQHRSAPYVEQFVVIVAGDANPTFLATPIPISPATSNGMTVTVDIEKNGDEKKDADTDGNGTQPH